MKNTDQRRASFEEIEIALTQKTARKFRAKYPGSCACCGHKFRPPSEIVYWLAPGRLVCWDCVQTVRLTQEWTSETGTTRPEPLPDIR